jgi:hypothetical protein
VRRGPVVFAVVVALLVASCGARTGLLVGVEIVTDAGCTSDASCDDGVACTLDQCDPSLHVCTHTLRDGLCQDGVFCTGEKHCDATLGCVAVPRNCDDGIACTIDSCVEGSKSCKHVPDNTKCPISQACNPTDGCEQRAFAHDQQTLFDVRLPSGVVTIIGPTGVELTDVALDPNNVLFGIAFDSLSTVNQSTGAATVTQSLSGQSLNGADFAPDGTFFVSGGTELFTLDPQSGALTEFAPFPLPLSSSGDIAFVGNRLLATAVNDPSNDTLVEFDVAAKTSSVVGNVGFGCVWGLASYGTSLYGFTCNGEIIQMNTTTGAGTLIQKVNQSFWGASAR